jgi:hypothetical protein
MFPPPALPDIYGTKSCPCSPPTHKPPGMALTRRKTGAACLCCHTGSSHPSLSRENTPHSCLTPTLTSEKYCWPKQQPHNHATICDATAHATQNNPRQEPPPTYKLTYNCTSRAPKHHTTTACRATAHLHQRYMLRRTAAPHPAANRCSQSARAGSRTLPHNCCSTPQQLHHPPRPHPKAAAISKAAGLTGLGSTDPDTPKTQATAAQYS